MTPFRRRLCAFEWQAVSDASLWIGIGAVVVVFVARMAGAIP